MRVRVLIHLENQLKLNNFGALRLALSHSKAQFSPEYKAVHRLGSDYPFVFLVNASRLFALYVLVRLHTFASSGNFFLSKLVSAMAVNWFITAQSANRDWNTKPLRVLANANAVLNSATHR